MCDVCICDPDLLLLQSVAYNPGTPVPEETFTRSHPTWSSHILYQLPLSTTIHSIHPPTTWNALISQNSVPIIYSKQPTRLGVVCHWLFILIVSSIGSGSISRSLLDFLLQRICHHCSEMMPLLSVSHSWHNVTIHHSQYWYVCNAELLLLLHQFNGLVSRTTWVSWYQKGNISLDLNDEPWDGGVLGCSGISWAIRKQSAPHSRQITTSTPLHSCDHQTDRPLYKCSNRQHLILYIVISGLTI